MAIRVPNLGTGSGAVGDGDNELKIRQDYNHNFEDQSNAASRLVGGAAGNLMEVGTFGLGARSLPSFPTTLAEQKTSPTGFYYTLADTYGMGDGQCVFINRGYWLKAIYFPVNTTAPMLVQTNTALNFSQSNTFLVLGINATQDPNGFLKGASPIAEIYSDKMELNHDATQQGGITFKKLGVGDYLIKGSLGFAQEGWYIETPKDANGNVLVAVVYEQLANNDLSIKTYAKKFDDETGDIVPNLLKPRDIPTGRFISLRLHELPKEPPVMPMDEPTTEV